MNSIYSLKAEEIVHTPVLLFDCELRSGMVERWSTQALTFNGAQYRPVILSYDAFELHNATDVAIDGADKIRVTVANADSRVSQVERSCGWKGGKLTVRHLFYDLINGFAISDVRVVFKGIANAPEEITDCTARLSFVNRFNLQRLLLPHVRIQRQCPWMFPDTSQRRMDAVDGGRMGKYSPLYGCGYSPDDVSGCGNLNGTEPYLSCLYTRESCIERGMFDVDSQGRTSRRFGGIEFVPPTILVRGHGEARSHASAVFENEGKYNDFIPIVYGTVWYQPPIIFSRNDGNLTHIEVLISVGEISKVHRVIVNGIEIPKAISGADMSSTGWFAVVSEGGRTGGFNAAFRNSEGQPLGDPYGGFATLAIVVPNRVNDGQSKPQIQILVDGLKLPTYGNDAEGTGEVFTKSPAWILLDLLRRSGWGLDEIAVSTFSRCAAYCNEQVMTRDLQGRETWIPRFQCNLLLRKRRSAAEILRGVRSAAGLFLRYNDSGQIELAIEGTIGTQQPDRAEYSNSIEPLNDGWPAYEFGDGANGFSGILRRPDGTSTLRLWCRGTADTPNRLTVEFQDEFNEYQQDSLSVMDYEDVLSTGHEITAGLPALGIANFNQAARLITMQLNRTLRGNTYVEFETGLFGLGVRPGDLITLTYLKEGLNRQLFRVIRVAPRGDCVTARITAQFHDDSWYAPLDGSASRARVNEHATRNTLPRPLGGARVDEYGIPQYGIAEELVPNSDGTYSAHLRVDFTTPATLGLGVAPPLVGLSPYIDTSQGQISGGVTYYYAVTVAGQAAGESPLSFIVRAEIPGGTSGASVRIEDLRFSSDAASMNVYRGTDPNRLYRIATVPATDAFTDDGLFATLATPPDGNYHHANFYWRFLHLSECRVTAATETGVTVADIRMVAQEHTNRIIRITAGTGRGQERTIVANDETVITTKTPWAVMPDSTSRISIVESGWRFAVAATSSPAFFDVPNRAGTSIEICGRATDFADREALYELSPITRWRIGGSTTDIEVPDAPTFAVTSSGRGTIEVSAIAFGNLRNTKTITSGTLTLHYFDEVNGAADRLLALPLTATECNIIVSTGTVIATNTVLQVDNELIFVYDVSSDGESIVAARGAFGSEAAVHREDALVSVLTRKTVVLPFPREFFGTPASGSYSQSVEIRNARVAAAELFVSNSRGNSESGMVCFSGASDGGLRTFSGGQFNLQVEGPLAIQSQAVPRLVVNEDYAVRDIAAVLSKPATTGDVIISITKNDSEYCALTIHGGERTSDVVEGYTLGCLRPDDELSLDIVTVPQTADSSPGRDLTVTIRV